MGMIIPFLIGAVVGGFTTRQVERRKQKTGSWKGFFRKKSASADAPSETSEASTDTETSENSGN